MASASVSRDARALRVGSAFLAALALLFLLLSLLHARDGRLLLAALWALTTLGAAVLAWGMRRISRRSIKRP